MFNFLRRNVDGYFIKKYAERERDMEKNFLLKNINKNFLSYCIHTIFPVIYLHYVCLTHLQLQLS